VRWSDSFAVAVVSGAAVLAGCGGDSAGSGSLDDSLGYLPSEPALVAVISTDLAQYATFDDKLDSLGVPGGGVEGMLRDAVEEEEDDGKRLSYEKDVKPLLGEDLVLGAPSPASLDTGEGVVAAIQISETEKLTEILEGPFFELERDGEAEGADLYRPKDPDSDDPAVALDGDTLVVAESSDTLREALKRQNGGDGLSGERFSAGVKGLPEDAPLQVVLSPEAALAQIPDADALQDVRWVSAVSSVGIGISASEDAIETDLSVRTDSGELSESDLPVATGEEELELLERDDELLSASAKQSVSTRFLLEAVGAAYPDSEFEERREDVESDLGLKLDDLLGLFDGPSVSAQTAAGIVATRSEVSDPQELAAGLRKLAPRLPELAEALGPIGERTALTAIRTIAPKLPLPGEGIDEAGVTVTPVPGERDLFTLSAADPEFSAPNELVVFGVVGDFFVVAGDEAAAKEIATAPTQPADGLSGGAIFSADPAFLGALVGADATQLPSLENLEGYVRASTEELTVHSELGVR